jgi:RNA polymerase sigma-70 factor, ECF subfamily
MSPFWSIDARRSRRARLLDTDEASLRFNVLNPMCVTDVSGTVAIRQQPRVRDRDEELLRALHDEHGPALLGYVTRLTGDAQHAEDIVQETLLRAWRRAPSLQGDPSSLRPWLFTVAHRLAIDEHRAVAARREGGPVPAELPVAGQLDRALEAWQVTEALATLSPDHRRVLVETYFRGRSVAEAAVALGVPPGTVKSRTYYALRALRAALEERGWGG